MPPSRFAAVSRWRNLELTAGKSSTGRHEEVGLGLPSDPNTCSTILDLCSDHSGSRLLFRSNTSSTHLSIISNAFGEQAFGKHARRLPSLAAAPPGAGSLADFAIETWQANPLLAAGGTDGAIAIRSLPFPDQDSFEAQLERSIPSLAVNGTPTGPATSLTWHPTSRGILLAGTGNALRLWDVQSTSPEPTTELDLDNVGVLKAAWSWDGKLVGVTSRDATVKLYDPRASSLRPVSSAQAHASKIKPTRLTFVSTYSNALLTTGFDAMRAREWALWDLRASHSAVARSSLDVSTSPLEPVCEPDRGLIFLTSRTSTNAQWLDIGSQSSSSPSASGSVPLGLPAGGPLVLAPTQELNVMRGEIARLVIPGLPGTGASNDCIVPASITIPRRQYIDFHADLFPDCMDRRSPAHTTATTWLGGDDAQLKRRSMDPDHAQWTGPPPAAGAMETSSALRPKSAAAASTDAAPAALESKQSLAALAARNGDGASAIRAPAPNAKDRSLNDLEQGPSHNSRTEAVPSDVAAEAAIVRKTAMSDSVDPPAAASTSVPPPSKRQFLTSAPKSSTAGMPRWSRRFIAGQTPLIAAHQNLASLDISRAPDARMLAVSTELFVFPVSGPGGRLGVQRISQTGRLPSPTPALSNGSLLLDFVIDQFNPRQVITAAEDGLIRVWDVPDDQEAAELPDSMSTPLTQFALPGGGRSGELAAHPHARGLLAVGPTDPEGSLHFLDISEPSSQRAISLDIPGGGAFSLAWSPNGKHLVVAGKDKTLRIVNPRAKSDSTSHIAASAEAHTSSRSFRAMWLSDEVLLTVGHGAGSARELLVFHLTLDSSSSSATLRRIARQGLDVSPAVLFPHWDRDTEVLWLWSKGERSISSFEIRLASITSASASHSSPSDIFTTLPAFQHSQPQLGLAFLPKTSVDVRSVEIASAVRLSRTELQRVSWRVPRARVEFFQDDVFVPTRDEAVSLLTAKEWLEGQDALVNHTLIDLKPSDMTPLSRAPAPTQTSHLPKGPIKRQETESERNDKILSSVFAKAKLDEADRADPSARNAAARRAPDDDDWGSD
ncbi:Tumor-specific antigen (contains WD repeats) [Ceraceosorus bombacis]|uniref:Coronin n=1 Tax=Ceraceosorus bombacis TaxID=401625 RepID=A0A0P1BC54_9BASI|nr:Tumor-specific antigen (contains WD repeats) [Ceraceosorus bombacis]